MLVVRKCWQYILFLKLKREIVQGIKVLALHLTDPTSILSTTYYTQSTSEYGSVIGEKN